MCMWQVRKKSVMEKCIVVLFGISCVYATTFSASPFSPDTTSWWTHQLESSRSLRISGSWKWALLHGACHQAEAPPYLVRASSSSPPRGRGRMGAGIRLGEDAMRNCGEDWEQEGTVSVSGCIYGAFFIIIIICLCLHFSWNNCFGF